MRKYIKKGAQHVQEFRTEMHVKQREDETFNDVSQRLKRNAQGLRSDGRTWNSVDMVDALKGVLILNMFTR